MAQELLTTFDQRLAEVALVPGAGGIFQIHVDDQLIWCRASHGGFPEIKLLKQKVRDLVAPDMELGHSDRKASADASDSSTSHNAGSPAGH